MPDRTTITTLLRLGGAVGSAALALAGARALAQSTDVEQLTVVAKPLKIHPDTVSYAVGYSDLNLRTEKGRKELADRVKIAAAYVCKKMDEPTEECRSFATRDAMVAARAATHQMRAHGAHPTAGSPWVPPPAG